jgi:hypothetical protein
MSTYEDAPATALVATCCACCARPLVDAPSVERGVGPTCAKKYGFGVAQGAADWTAAAALAGRAGVVLASTDDARKAANALVYRCAALQGDATIPDLVAAIGALGFAKVAEAIARNLVPVVVSVTDEGDRLAVDAPYLPTLTAALQAIPGRQWDRERKLNVVPAAERRALWIAFRKTLAPGTVVVGTRGVAVLRAA